MPSFPQKYGFEKSQTIFSDFWSWCVCRVSWAKSQTRWRFFSLTAVSVELAMLSECVPSLSTKCALWKTNKSLQRVLVVPAWQGALHENNREKLEKNLLTRFCSGRGAAEVQITNRAICKCDLSCPTLRIWGKFLRFGLRDFKSLAICDLWFGALRSYV